MSEFVPKNRLVQYVDPGIIVDPNPAQTSVIVTTTNTLIRSANDQRSGLLIKNPASSTGSVWISVDGFPATADATRLQLAPGETLEMFPPEPIYQLSIYGITSSGSVTLSITEFS